MRGIRHGWQLTKKSWQLLRSHRELFRFPVYASMLALVVLLATVAPGLYQISDSEYVPGGLLTAVGLYLSSFIAIYFGVALAATADLIFSGQQATTSDGFVVARERLGAIAAWALLAALVGTLISALQQSGSIGEAIVGTLVGAAWSLITFLAVPVIAFEGTGPFTTLKRSASLFKRRWAGQVTGDVAIGGIVLLVGVLPAVALIVIGVLLWIGGGTTATGMVIGQILVGIGIIALVISMLVLQAMRGVFGVALYRFASDGNVPHVAFTEEDLESAVRTR